MGQLGRMGCRVQCAAAVAWAAGGAFAQQPKVADLGSLGAESRAYALSADGSIAVGESGGQAFLWSAGTGMVPLGGGRATGVSAHGEVICGYAGALGASGMRSVRWTAWTSASRVDLNTFGNGQYSAANCVSASGAVIFGNAFDGEFDTVAYRWSSASGTVALGSNPYTGGVGTAWGAQATSADGAVVVGNIGVASMTATRWVGGVSTGPIIGAAESSAQGVSADGTVVVGYYRPTPGAQRAAFRWTSAGGGSLLSIPGLGGTGQGAVALSVTVDGSTIVGSDTGSQGQEAFIWDALGGTRPLRDSLIAQGETQLQSWVLTSATSISPDGRAIAGYGVNPLGQVRAWRVAYECYANCDHSTMSPVLNVQDFTCFLQEFAAGDAAANCDGSTAPPTLTVTDFTCFLQRYTAGCT